MTDTQTYKMKGMQCASCASIIEKTFKKQEGVHEVHVNYSTETAKVAHDAQKVSSQQLSAAIKPLGYSLVVEPTAEAMGMSASEHAAHLGLNQSKKEKLDELAAMKRQLFVALPLAAVAAV